MVLVGAVTVHVTDAAPAIAPGTLRTREKASSPPAFVTSPHPPGSTTVVSMHGGEQGAYMDVIAVEVCGFWQPMSVTADCIYHLTIQRWLTFLLFLAVNRSS